MSIGFRKFLLLIAVVLCFTSLYLFYTQLPFVQKSKQAEGTIIGYIEQCNGSEFANCETAPKIEFTTQTGEKVVFVNRLTTKLSVNSMEKQENNLDATVIVLYDPQNPQDARIDSFMNKWFLPVFSLVTSVLLFMFVKLVKVHYGFNTEFIT